MTRQRLITLVALAIFVGLLLLAATVRGQDDYGIAQFFRNDCWSRDGLKAHFVMDPGVRGDSLNGSGSFESWTGPSGGCTDCPTGWTCACAAGDTDQEATLIYNHDTSLFIEPGAAFAPMVYQVTTFEANKCYQVSWCHYGENANEDFAVVATNAALTDVYDWSTDSWGGGPVTTFINIATSWTCQRFFLRNGPVEKASYLIGFTVTSGDGDGIYVDQFKVQELNACDVTGSRGNVLTNPATSDPLWGHSESLLPRVGTGPAYKTGEKLDGINDFQSCADATCEMDPVNWESGGFFSVGCRVVTDTVMANQSYLINKYNAGGNQRSWQFYRWANSLVYLVSDDGINTDSSSKAMLTVDALHNFVSTIDLSGGAGAYEYNIYYDAYQATTDAAMTEGAPFDSTANFEIGAGLGATTWDGSILECSFWEKELTAIEANKYISPYFPATNHGDGFYVDTCSQAASHATCSTQVCRDGTPNSCQAEGSGVMACYQGFTEQLDNNSYEAHVGDPSDGDFSDWTEGGNITAYLADSKHGDVSTRMKGGSLTGECIIGGGAGTFFEISAKALTSGTLEVWLREYDTGFCTNQLAITTIITCTPGSVWDDCGALFDAWHVDTSSYKIQIVDSVDGDMLVDAVSVKEASYRTPWVHCPTGSGIVSYTNREYILNSPLARFVEKEGEYAYESGFCGSMWLYTNWPGDDGVTHQIMTSPGTVGINNRWIVNKPNSNNIQFVLYDAAGALRQYTLIATSINWSAGGWKYLQWCSNNTDNVLKGRHYNVNNKVWYNWTSSAGAGTGIQDGQSTDLHIGHDANASYLDGEVSEIHLSPYSNIWPQKGFNNGRPPINGKPY